MSQFNLNEEVVLDGELVSTGRGSRELIRQVIDASKKPESIEDAYKELVRSLRAEFSNLHYINRQNEVVGVNCIQANPERAAATQVAEDTLILPVMAIGVPNTEEDKDRNRYGAQILTETLWDDVKQRAIRTVRLAPKAVRVNFELYLWSYYQSHINQLTSQIQLMFNPALELETKYSEDTKVFLIGETDESELDVVDQKDRVLIRKFDLQVETYLPTPRFLYTSTGRLEEFHVDAIISQSTPPIIAAKSFVSLDSVDGGILSVSGPSFSYSPEGNAISGFNPPNQTYLIENIGSATIDVVAVGSVPWIGASIDSLISLAPQQNTYVSISAIPEETSSLSVGTYGGTFSFVNITNDVGSTAVILSLGIDVTLQCSMLLSGNSLLASGVPNGPYIAPSGNYLVSNTGSLTAPFSITTSAAWLSATASSTGVLQPTESMPFSLIIMASGASSLEGEYSTQVFVQNLLNGSGTSSIDVFLSVHAQNLSLADSSGGALDMTVIGRAGASSISPSSKEYRIGNTGYGTLDYLLSTTAPWLTIVDSGVGDLGILASSLFTVNLIASATSSLPEGATSGVVSAINLTNGSGNASAIIYLIVGPALAGELALLTPPAGFNATAYEHSPWFDTSSQTLVFKNIGTASLNYLISATSPYVSISSGAGTLAVDQTSSVLIALVPSALSAVTIPGAFVASSFPVVVSAFNLTTSAGNFNFLVTPSIYASAELTVSGASFDVSTLLSKQFGTFTPDHYNYIVSNAGYFPLDFTIYNPSSFALLTFDNGHLESLQSSTLSITFSPAVASPTVPSGQHHFQISAINTTNNIGGSAINITVCSVDTPSGILYVSAAPYTYDITGNAVDGLAPSSKQYRIQNIGNSAIEVFISDDVTWLQTSIAGVVLLPSGTNQLVTLTPIASQTSTLLAGLYTGTVDFINITNGLGTTSVAASLNLNKSLFSQLLVSGNSFLASGPIKGPYTPSTINYTVSNVSNMPVPYAVTVSAFWLSSNVSSPGQLAIGSSITFRVNISSNASTLGDGEFNTQIFVKNTFTDLGTSSVDVSLKLKNQYLFVSSVSGEDINFFSGGRSGTVFSPSSKTYQIANQGYGNLSYLVSTNVSWVSCATSAGTLSSLATSSFVLTLNGVASTLPQGTYTATVCAINLTSGLGGSSFNVFLDVGSNLAGTLAALTPPTPGFSSSSVEGSASFTTSSQTFKIINTGTASLNYLVSTISPYVNVSGATGTLGIGVSAEVNISLIPSAVSAIVLSPLVVSSAFFATVSAINTTNDLGTFTVPVGINIYGPPELKLLNISPNLSSVGTVGVSGSFHPISKFYTISNVGAFDLTYQVTSPAAWVSSTITSAILPAASSTTFLIGFIPAVLASFPPGVTTTPITIENITPWYYGLGTSTVTGYVSAMSPPAGILSISSTSFTYSTTGDAIVGYTPSSHNFIVSNIGTDTIVVSSYPSVNWVSCTLPTSITLASGQASAGSIGIIKTETSAYIAGIQYASFNFINLTNGYGSSGFAINLNVSNGPLSSIISVSGGSFNSSGPVSGSFTPASALYIVSNIGSYYAAYSVPTPSATWLSAFGTLTAVFGLSGSSNSSASFGLKVLNSVSTLGPGIHTTQVLVSSLYKTFIGGYGGDCEFLGTSSIDISVDLSSQNMIFYDSEGDQLTLDIISTAREGVASVAPSSNTYLIGNLGYGTLNYQISSNKNWINISGISTIGLGASGTLTGTLGPLVSSQFAIVLPPSAVSALAAGTTSGTVLVRNTTNSSGNGSFNVSVVITPTAPATAELTLISPIVPGTLGGFVPSGFQGSANYQPSAQALLIKNTGTSAMNYLVSTLSPGVIITNGAGTLAIGASTIVSTLLDHNFISTVSIPGSLLSTFPGLQVSAYNLTNGVGNFQYVINVLILKKPTVALSGSPASALVLGLEGGSYGPNYTFYVSNSGNYTARWRNVIPASANYVRSTPASGILAAGTSASFVLSMIASIASTLPAGFRIANITVSDISFGPLGLGDGQPGIGSGVGGGTVNLHVSTISSPGFLVVNPHSAMSWELVKGTSTYVPASPYIYSIQNTGASSFLAAVSSNAPNYIKINGHNMVSTILNPGQTSTVSINLSGGAVSTLPVGTYNVGVFFINLTSSLGDFGLPATMKITSAGTVWEDMTVYPHPTNYKMGWVIDRYGIPLAGSPTNPIQYPVVWALCHTGVSAPGSTVAPGGKFGGELKRGFKIKLQPGNFHGFDFGINALFSPIDVHITGQTDATPIYIRGSGTSSTFFRRAPAVDGRDKTIGIVTNKTSLIARNLLWSDFYLEAATGGNPAGFGIGEVGIEKISNPDHIYHFDRWEFDNIIVDGGYNHVDQSGFLGQGGKPPLFPTGNPNLIFSESAWAYTCFGVSGWKWTNCTMRNMAREHGIYNHGQKGPLTVRNCIFYQCGGTAMQNASRTCCNPDGGWPNPITQQDGIIPEGEIIFEDNWVADMTVNPAKGYNQGHCISFNGRQNVPISIKRNIVLLGYDSITPGWAAAVYAAKVNAGGDTLPLFNGCLVSFTGADAAYEPNGSMVLWDNQFSVHPAWGSNVCVRLDYLYSLDASGNSFIMGNHKPAFTLASELHSGVADPYPPPVGSVSSYYVRDNNLETTPFGGIYFPCTVEDLDKSESDQPFVKAWVGEDTVFSMPESPFDVTPDPDEGTPIGSHGGR